MINAAFQKVATTEPEVTNQEGLAELDKDECRRLLYQTAKLIQEDITQCQGISVKPLNINDLTLKCSRCMIPDSLYWILCWIIANPGNEVEDELTFPSCGSEADKKRVLMIAQDVVHCASQNAEKLYRRDQMSRKSWRTLQSH